MRIKGLECIRSNVGDLRYSGQGVGCGGEGSGLGFLGLNVLLYAAFQELGSSLGNAYAVQYTGVYIQAMEVPMQVRSAGQIRSCTTWGTLQDFLNPM